MGLSNLKAGMLLCSFRVSRLCLFSNAPRTCLFELAIFPSSKKNPRIELISPTNQSQNQTKKQSALAWLTFIARAWFAPLVMHNLDQSRWHTGPYPNYQNGLRRRSPMPECHAGLSCRLVSPWSGATYLLKTKRSPRSETFCWSLSNAKLL
jgi:hypothetical protein